MTGLEIVLASAGLLVFVLVIVAMILITPRGQVEVHVEGSDPMGSNLSPAPVPREPTPVPVRSAG